METILIIDDEVINLDFFQSCLSSAGYNVITGNSGKKGIELFNRERPDLVLLDVMMPVMDGIETARVIRQDVTSLHVPIIFISAVVTDTLSKVKAMDLGASDYIIKPVDDDELCSKIRASLRTKNLYEELLATQNLLQTSKNKYKNILESIQEGYCEVDLKGNMTFFNDSACRMFGYPRKKFMGMNYREYTTIKTAEKMYEKFNAIFRTGKQSDLIDCEIIRGDGSIGILELTADLMLDGDSRPVGFYGIARDVTEKKRAEKELWIRSLAVEKSINAIAITDTAGGFTFVNNSFIRLMGYDDRTELIGKTILQCCHPDDHEAIIGVMEVLQEIGIWVGELSIKKKDGALIYIMLSASIIKNNKDENIGMILSFVDITLRKKIDYALKESQQVITRRNKNIERDLKLAQVTLKNIVKQEVPRIDSINIDYRYYPMEKLGGDFFCFYKYQKESCGVFICDISGHGVASSLYLSLLKSLVDKISVKYGQSPTKFLAQLNEELAGKMSTYFITGIYGLFTHNKRSNEIVFSYSNGGHPGPIVVKKNGEMKLHSGRSTLIGISHDITFDSTTIRLQKGDKLFLYTDGIPETTNRGKDMIGYDDKLLELFEKSHQVPLGESLDAITRNISRFRDGADITDDVLTIGFEIV
ncbi:MAG: PAS domain S-box protein [Spirochaetes bacterium]|nr:PAS domain S-box protein [Spirochaetota bacterium]